MKTILRLVIGLLVVSIQGLVATLLRNDSSCSIFRILTISSIVNICRIRGRHITDVLVITAWDRRHVLVGLQVVWVRVQDLLCTQSRDTTSTQHGGGGRGGGSGVVVQGFERVAATQRLKKAAVPSNTIPVVPVRIPDPDPVTGSGRVLMMVSILLHIQVKRVEHCIAGTAKTFLDQEDPDQRCNESHQNR